MKVRFRNIFDLEVGIILIYLNIQKYILTFDKKTNSLSQGNYSALVYSNRFLNAEDFP